MTEKPMSSTNDIKKGAVIKHNNDLYVVTAFQFVNPGKGAAFTKTKMKSISTGKTVEITYKSGESVETVEVLYGNMQYLYQSGSRRAFMDQKTFETVEIDEDMLGNDANYLKEGLEVVVATYEGTPVAVQLPKKIKYTVTEAPPAVKGDTAGGNVTKEVTLDNGLKTRAPIFVKEGEEILVNTETGEYAGRARE